MKTSSLLSIAVAAVLVVVSFGWALTSAIADLPSDMELAGSGGSAHYEGTCDNWYRFYENDTWHTYSGAKIVESSWDITIQGGKAIFFLKFIELNIEEEEPGTYDNFKVVMIADSVEPTVDGYIVRGTSYWWKNEILTGPLGTVVTVSETNLPTQFSMEIPGWLVTGSLKV